MTRFRSALTAVIAAARPTLSRFGGRFRGPAKLIEQVRHPLGRLSPLRDRVVDATKVDAKPFLTTRRDWIEESDTLDVLSTARTAAIRHHDVIERTLDRAATCQPNDHHKTFRFRKNQ